MCYRDVAWLNGDRLVLVAHEGLVILASPSDVLQEWNVGGAERPDRPGSCSPTSAIPAGGGTGGNAGSIETPDSLCAGTLTRI